MGQLRVARSAVVDAPASLIFDIIASPARHAEFDGSGTVQEAADGPDRLGPDVEFGMGMRMGVEYRMGNRVVEFEEGRLIAWRHSGAHRWRWQVEPLDAGTARVTETFDYSTVPAPVAFLYQMLGFPSRNARSIEASLLRLKALAEKEHAAG
ncbi:SRPBCC family protein [Nocardiopsis potens]|uniref:SRPBCC family protein n=1 Tax=Nocardiopsis potens TaxID=1246458 RepID=UPI00047823B6|nr:SRPBCC family protein [Nocardiopsis potens]